jgi:hypothetical protein
MSPSSRQLYHDVAELCDLLASWFMWDWKETHESSLSRPLAKIPFL